MSPVVARDCSQRLRKIEVVVIAHFVKHLVVIESGQLYLSRVLRLFCCYHLHLLGSLRFYLSFPGKVSDLLKQVLCSEDTSQSVAGGHDIHEYAASHPNCVHFNAALDSKGLA